MLKLVINKIQNQEQQFKLIKKNNNNNNNNNNNKHNNYYLYHRQFCLKNQSSYKYISKPIFKLFIAFNVCCLLKFICIINMMVNIHGASL